jgi:hypothetical protein
MKTAQEIVEKHWVKVIEKDSRRLVGYYYNPYNRPAKEIAAMFVSPECIQEIIAYKVV